jgi:hypothetical protein
MIEPAGYMNELKRLPFRHSLKPGPRLFFPECIEIGRSNHISLARVVVVVFKMNKKSKG